MSDLSIAVMILLFFGFYGLGFLTGIYFMEGNKDE